MVLSFFLKASNVEIFGIPERIIEDFYPVAGISNWKGIIKMLNLC